jgi:mxaJ protein
MSSACHSVWSTCHHFIVMVAVVASCACGGPSGNSRAVAPLRVCADPNNLPFSNHRLEGFENRLADVVAAELGTTVQYTWWAQRRGFLRNTLNAGVCDVVLGLPSSLESVEVTRPYYRSTYVFVTRRAEGLQIHSFDDPRLRRLRIGVPIIGEDGANAPPAHALSRRGIVGNVVGYSVYGDYTTANPPARLIEAVAQSHIDLAIAWGPLAGFFAARQNVPLDVVSVQPPADMPFLPIAFDISLAVRRGETALIGRLDQALNRRRGDIDRILAEYHVPRVDARSEMAP